MTSLFKTILPVKLELWAVLPPKVAVPLLPACTVIARATIKAPFVNKAAFEVPLVSPNNTALVALPKAPADPDGAFEPTTNVPALIVVVPV